MATTKQKSADKHNSDLAHSSKFNEKLAGKTIRAVRYMYEEEANQFGWYKRPLVLLLNDSTYIILQSDDEGNDGGAAYVYNKLDENMNFTIYTI